MGKSPGKWIKAVLFGKKSTKSNVSKGRERASNGKEVLIAAKAAETEVALDQSLAPNSVNSAADRSKSKSELENKNAASISDDAFSFPETKHTDLQESPSQDARSDPQKLLEERAATTVQAAFRGYLAWRAFWALKGIIRLQALIRGHLVRRQAVATLSCAMGIVKLQALVRGRQVRHSDIGMEVQRKCRLRQSMEGKLVDSVGADVSLRFKKFFANDFVSKLLASTPTVMPLHLHYDNDNPNSVLSWLERWSISRFWKPAPRPKKTSDSKSQRKHGNEQTVETETGSRPKRSVRKVPAANIDSSSAQPTNEFEKPKRNIRKVSSNPADTMQENPQSELEKVKRNLRKVHNPVVENSVQQEVEFEKPKLNVEKVPTSSGHEILEQGLNYLGEQSVNSLSEKIKNETALKVVKQPEAEISQAPLEMTETLDLSSIVEPVDESKPLVESENKDENSPKTNGELNHKEDMIGNENQKTSRKASVAAKQERAENGIQNSPTLPSYMQATESAKAKLRLQGSPRSAPQEGTEKNNVARRHSLPSSTNSKISSQSPRTQRVVHAAGKGGSKGERATLASRDGNAKVTQVEWRR